jgi:hypothetical protein
MTVKVEVEFNSVKIVCTKPAKGNKPLTYTVLDPEGNMSVAVEDLVLKFFKESQEHADVVKLFNKLYKK